MFRHVGFKFARFVWGVFRKWYPNKLIEYPDFRCRYNGRLGLYMCHVKQNSRYIRVAYISKSTGGVQGSVQELMRHEIPYEIALAWITKPDQTDVDVTGDVDAFRWYFKSCSPKHYKTMLRYIYSKYGEFDKLNINYFNNTAELKLYTLSNDSGDLYCLSSVSFKNVFA